MNKIAATKKILKYFGIKIPVIFDVDFYVEENEFGEPSKLAIQNPLIEFDDIDVQKIENEQKLFTEKLCQKNKIEYNYFLFALLHEIGHIQTYEFFLDNEEYVNDVELLLNLFNQGLLTHQKYIELYNNIEQEKMANDWVVDFIKNNLDMYKKFEKIWG